MKSGFKIEDLDDLIINIGPPGMYPTEEGWVIWEDGHWREVSSKPQFQYEWDTSELKKQAK